MLKILFATLLILTLVSAQSCGGNCINNWCSTCDCGETPSYPDLDSLCRKYSWNKECCKCIILRVSKGNTNTIIGRGWGLTVYASGLAIFSEDECKGSNLQRCDPETTLTCMQSIYSKTNDWSRWYSDAKACGCPVGSHLKTQ
jgi:hypothetical protein